MFSKSLGQLVICRWREFKREPSAFYFVLLMPVFWMLVLGLAFSNSDSIKYDVGLVVDEQHKQTPDESNLFDILSNHTNINLTTGSFELLQRQLQRGSVQLIVVLNNNKLNYFFDKTNTIASGTRYFLDDLIQKTFGQKNSFKTYDDTDLKVGVRYIDFLIPGLLAFSLLSTSLFGTGMVIVVNRRENLLKRLRTTPMSTTQYIWSHILGRYLIMFLEIAIIMLTAALVFDFSIKGGLLAYLFLAVLGTSTFTAISMFFGAKGKNTSAYSAVVNLFVLIMMLLSGIWFARSNFPSWLESISSFLPLALLADGLRKISLEGLELKDISFEVGFLCIYLVLFVQLAKKRFKWV